MNPGGCFTYTFFYDIHQERLSLHLYGESSTSSKLLIRLTISLFQVEQPLQAFLYNLLCIVAYSLLSPT